MGPFKIIRQITPVSFRLALPAHYRISPTFHVSLLKPAGGPRGEEVLEEAGDQRVSPIVVDGQEAYQVREILYSRRRGRLLQYLVDWEGYGPEEQSWVNADDILDPSLTTVFHRIPPPGQTSPETPRKTPASFASSRQEPLPGEGLCHKFSFCGSLRLPPEGTVTGVLTVISSHSHYSPELWLITGTGASH